MTGSDNEKSYKGFAFVLPDGQIVLWKRFRNDLFLRYSDMIQYPSDYEKLGAEYLYSGRCRICNKKLTNPVSIHSGIGPECSKKVGENG